MFIDRHGTAIALREAGGKMDRPIADDIVMRRRFKRAAAGVLVVGSAIAALVLLPGWLRPSVDRSRLRIGRVELATVEATLDAAGVVVPAAQRSIVSPFESRVLRVLKRAGDTVHTGDPIVELDTGAARLDLSRLEDRLAEQANEKHRLSLTLERELLGLRAQAESRKLDAEVLAHRAAQSEQLSVSGLVSAEALEAVRAEAKKAAIEVRQLEESAAIAEKVAAAQLEGVALAVRTLDKEVAEARRQLELATARADMDGIVEWVADQEGTTVRRGDPVARVARPNAFRVEGTIADVHAARLAAGMPVHVVTGGRRLAGTVAAVLPAIEGGAAKFLIDLANPSDPELRQNLRVDVHVVVAAKEGVASVARGVFVVNGTAQPVFVVEGDRLVRRNVRFGLLGFDRVEIVDGVPPGGEIVLSDMQDYAHLETVRLR
jgi:HlyD family secretion protein